MRSVSDTVRLEIRTMASNLIYAATILNYEFIKRQVIEFDLETPTADFTMLDSADAEF